MTRSSRAPSELSPTPNVEELEATLAEMAHGTGEAEGILASLAAALFPSGPPGIEQLTWPEKGNVAAESDVPLDAETRLRLAEKRFRALVEQIPAVTFYAVLGEGKNEVYVSPHIEQLLGFTQREWLEAPFLWYWQLHPDDREMWHQEFARGIRTGGPFRAECRLFARDGRTVWVHGEARLMKDELGRPEVLQGIAYDITEMKRAQEILLAETKREARLEESLAIARRVQTSILPRSFKVPGLEIAAAMQPATEVGGDYYDLLPFDGGAWFSVGDVSGHGLDSGLVMLMLQSALAAIVGSGEVKAPREVLVRLNAVLHDNIRNRLVHDDHVTLTLFRFAQDGSIRFAGAHEEMIVWRKATQKVELVRTPGTWLGGAPDIAASTVDSDLRLEPGDLLVLYTDGIIEPRNDAGEEFGLERLCDAVAKRATLPCDKIRDELFQLVQDFAPTQDDDRTLMVLRYQSAGAVEKPKAVPTQATNVVAPHFPSTSLLEDSEQSSPVSELAITEPDTRLHARGFSRLDVLAAQLVGLAEIPEQLSLRGLLGTLHALALERKSKIVEIDVRTVRFMSSSCIKELVGHLSQVRALPEAERYRVRYVLDPFVRWQRPSLQALYAFAPDVVMTRE